MLDGASLPPASPFPVCLSECPLAKQHQDHHNASVSLSPHLSLSLSANALCFRRDPLVAMEPRCFPGHMLHYFALPVHCSVLFNLVPFPSLPNR